MSGEHLPPVVAELKGENSQFVRSQQEARAELKKTADEGSGHLGRLGGAMSTFGQIATVGMGAGVAGGIAFAKSTADSFKDVAGEVGKLQRMTGQSAEEMSRWRYVAQISNVSNDQLATGFKKLAIDMDGHTDKLAKYGIASHDATGKARPMNEVLLDTADLMSKTSDASKRVAISQDLFGKSGTDLLPVLLKGRDGIKELADEADRSGLVLGQDQVNAAKAAGKAQRELSAGWQGLQVQIGQYTLPLISAVTSWLADKMPIAIGVARLAIEYLRQAVGFFLDGWTGDMDGIADGPMAGIRQFGIVARDVFEWLKTFVVDEVLPRLHDAFDAVVGTVQNIVHWFSEHEDAAKSLAVGIGVALVVAVTQYTLSMAAAAVATIAAALPLYLIIGALALLAAAVYYAYNHFQWFHDAVDAVGRWLRDTLWPIIQDFWKNFQAGMAIVVQWIQDNWPGIATTIYNVWNRIYSAVEAVVTWWTGTAWPMIQNFANNVKDTFITVRDSVTGAWSWIWDRIDYFVNLFTTVKDRISGAFIGAFDAVKDSFKNAMNWIIDKWNGLSFEAPAWVKATSGIGFLADGHMPQIARLAEGGISPAVPGGRMIQVSEGGQDEAIIPLPKIGPIVRDAMREVLGAGGGGEIRIVVELDGKVLTESVVNHVQRVQVGSR